MSRIENRKKSKISKFFKVFIIVILITIVAAIATAYIYLNVKFKNVNFKGLDEDELGINENLYSEVSDKISKKDFSKIKNILLIASDSENGYDKEAHADVIMLFSLNPLDKSIKLISIPRDTAVDIPEYMRYKLNYSYTLGEEQLLLKMINDNFGLNIDEYITVDFEGLIHIINTIGGIELYITESERVYINNTCKDAYKVSGDSVKYLYSTGKVTLNGEQALSHARNRTVGNDLTRTERHRDIIESILNKLSGMGANAITALSDDFLQDVTTNIDINEYIALFPEVLTNVNSYKNNLISTMIPSMDYSTGAYASNGGYIIETNKSKAKEDFIKYLYEM